MIVQQIYNHRSVTTSTHHYLLSLLGKRHIIITVTTMFLPCLHHTDRISWGLLISKIHPKILHVAQLSMTRLSKSAALQALLLVEFCNASTTAIISSGVSYRSLKKKKQLEQYSTLNFEDPSRVELVLPVTKKHKVLSHMLIHFQTLPHVRFNVVPQIFK